MSGLSVAELDALIVEATVDCYDEDEQVLGLYSVMVDELAVPFQTIVLGVAVTVEDLDLTGRGHIVAQCSRRGIHRRSWCWTSRCRRRLRPVPSGSRRTGAGPGDPPPDAVCSSV